MLKNIPKTIVVVPPSQRTLALWKRYNGIRTTIHGGAKIPGVKFVSRVAVQRMVDMLPLPPWSKIPARVVTDLALNYVFSDWLEDDAEWVRTNDGLPARYLYGPEWSLSCSSNPGNFPAETFRKLGIGPGANFAGCAVSVVNAATGQVYGTAIPGSAVIVQEVQSGVPLPNLNGRPFSRSTRAAPGAAVQFGLRQWTVPKPDVAYDAVPDRVSVARNPLPDANYDADGKSHARPSHVVAVQVAPGLQIVPSPGQLTMVQPVARPVAVPQAWKPQIVSHKQEPAHDKKTTVAAATKTLLKVYHGLTELGEAVDDVYQALPKSVRKKCGARRNFEKAACVWSNYDKVDIPRAVFNIVLDQLVDVGVGRFNRQLQGLSGRAVEYQAGRLPYVKGSRSAKSFAVGSYRNPVSARSTAGSFHGPAGMHQTQFGRNLQNMGIFEGVPYEGFGLPKVSNFLPEYSVGELLAARPSMRDLTGQ